MLAIQNIPNYVDGVAPKKSNFSNTEELLNIEWINFFSIYNNFYRFSISRDKGGCGDKLQHILMAEFNNGSKWHAVAFIEDNDISGIDDMPEWEAKDR